MISSCPGETREDGLLTSVCPLRQICNNYSSATFHADSITFMPYDNESKWCNGYKEISDSMDAFEVIEYKLMDIGWEHTVIPKTSSIPNFGIFVRYFNTNTKPVKQIFEMIISQAEIREYFARKGYKINWTSQLAFVGIFNNHKFMPEIIEDVVNQFMFAEVP